MPASLANGCIMVTSKTERGSRKEKPFFSLRLTGNLRYAGGGFMKFDAHDMKILAHTDFLPVILPDCQAVFEDLSLEDRSKLQNRTDFFPRKCTTCGRVYDDLEAFLQETDPTDGDSNVFYQLGSQTKLFKYRNCPAPCNSTLVAVSGDRRDSSPKGLKRRQYFDQAWKALKKSMPHFHPNKLHDLLLYIFREMLHEGLSPEVAYHMLKEDIKHNRFRGFVDEPGISVEKLGAS